MNYLEGAWSRTRGAVKIDCSEGQIRSSIHRRTDQSSKESNRTCSEFDGEPIAYKGDLEKLGPSA
jgi:hypothetical protein